MSALKSCSLPWCRQTGPHLTFKNFPSNEIRQMQWLTLLDVAETWKDVSPDKISSYIICNFHFDTKGNLLRATSTPLVTTAHVQPVPPPPKIPQKLSKFTEESSDDEEIPPKKPKLPAKSRTQPPRKVQKPKIQDNSPKKAPAYAPQPAGPSTRESFSLAKKMEIVRMLESGLKQSDVCRLVKIPKSTVWCIWKSREKIQQAFMSNGPERKKLRKSNFEEVDQALFKWYNSVSSQNVNVTGRLLQTMAESFAQDLGQTSFVCTTGWLERFKQRYCIVLSQHKRLRKAKQDQVNHILPPEVATDAVSINFEPLISENIRQFASENVEAITSENSDQLVSENVEELASKSFEEFAPKSVEEFTSETNGKSPSENHTSNEFLIQNQSKFQAPSVDASNKLTDASPNFDDASINSTDANKNPEFSSIKLTDASRNVTDASKKLNDASHRSLIFSNSIQATDWIRHSYPKLLLKNSHQPYKPADIFAAEEFGLLYRISPEESHKISKSSLEKPFEISRERLTVLICANSDGSEKRRLLILGQSASPSCIVSTIGMDFSRLPADYQHTTDPSSWITSTTFTNWLTAWNEELKEQDRQVVLILKPTPVHEALPPAGLSNVKVLLTPRPISNLVHPFQGEGIVKEFKWRYRRIQLERMVRGVELRREPGVTIFDAVTMASTAWNEVPIGAVVSAFQGAGLVGLGPERLRYEFRGFSVGDLVERARGVGLISGSFNFSDFASLEDTLVAIDLQSERSTSQLSTHSDQDQRSLEGQQGFFPPPPPSLLTCSEIQTYLDTIKIWALTRRTSCPQTVHLALSTLESFTNGHLDT